MAGDRAATATRSAWSRVRATSASGQSSGPCSVHEAPPPSSSVGYAARATRPLAARWASTVLSRPSSRQRTAATRPGPAAGSSGTGAPPGRHAHSSPEGSSVKKRVVRSAEVARARRVPEAGRRPDGVLQLRLCGRFRLPPVQQRAVGGRVRLHPPRLPRDRDGRPLHAGALQVAPRVPAAALLLRDHAQARARVAHEDVRAALGVHGDGGHPGAVALLVRVADGHPVQGREQRAVVGGVHQARLTGHGGPPGHQMGVRVDPLPDREDRVQPLLAADPAGRPPGTARQVLRAAQHGLAGDEVDAEPPVAAPYEPVAVHPLTVGPRPRRHGPRGSRGRACGHGPVRGRGTLSAWRRTRPCW